MRKSGLALLFTVTVFLSTVMISHAQFREDLNRTDYSGPLVKQEQSSKAGNWSNLFNMNMSHSYSMNFMSYGGRYQNINAYTNSMDFFFTDRLTGSVDISLLHSPFGGSYLNSGNGGMGTDIILRNAELNYQINDKSHISIQFQQYPYSPFRGSPYDRYGFNRY